MSILAVYCACDGPDDLQLCPSTDMKTIASVSESFA